MRAPLAGHGVRATQAGLAVLALVATACGAGGSSASIGAGQTGISAVPATAPAPVTTLVDPGPVPAPALPLNGCPPPPPKPGTGTPAPAFVPAVLVPEASLAAAPAPPVWTSQLGPLKGKGMWLWKFGQSEGGNADAIVNRAAATGLRQLWVRVGDSQDRFYAASVLDDLVPKAHRKGIAVIGWGFPYLFDPADDARWAADALAWRSPTGDVLDGFSPDLELGTEGVAVTEKRLTLYLGLVRQAAGSRLVVATVYRPSDRLWPDAYPYAAIAPYVDAFAPMVYWECQEPGALTLQAVDRLKTLRPVHVIGQAYDSTADGGRTAAPDAEETNRFLDVAHRDGALGASFWVWQDVGAEQWSALAAFAWPVPK